MGPPSSRRRHLDKWRPYQYIYMYIRGPPTTRRRHPVEWRPYRKPQTSGCATSATAILNWGTIQQPSWSRSSAKCW